MTAASYLLLRHRGPGRYEGAEGVYIEGYRFGLIEIRRVYHFLFPFWQNHPFACGHVIYNPIKQTIIIVLRPTSRTLYQTLQNCVVASKFKSLLIRSRLLSQIGYLPICYPCRKQLNKIARELWYRLLVFEAGLA